MDDALLNRFYNDEHTREEVIKFLHAFINQEGLERLYNRKDVSSVADARELIDLAFSNMQDLYGIKDTAPKSTSTSR